MAREWLTSANLGSSELRRTFHFMSARPRHVILYHGSPAFLDCSSGQVGNVLGWRIKTSRCPRLSATPIDTMRNNESAQKKEQERPEYLYTI